MFLFSIKAVPDLENHDPSRFEDIEGAYVNIWINFPEQEAAEVLARFYINKEGWLDQETDEKPVWLDDVDPKDENYPFYQEALEYGSAMLFNTILKDDE